MNVEFGRALTRSGLRIWRIGDAELDEARRELRVGGVLRSIEAKPFALLQELLRRGGDVATKLELTMAVWPGVTVVEQSLTTAISKLRAALGDQGRMLIEAVHGIGYRIAVPVQFSQAVERSRLAFAFRSGDLVPNRPQWQLDRLLGNEAVQDVWLARHGKTGEQRVFKFADTSERLDALKREAAISRILQNALGERDDLVRVAEWNFNTRPYFTECAYGGPSLPEWAQSQGGIGSVPVAERIALMTQIVRTVAAAHGVGVLHRDIKPANVLVATDREAPTLRLVDFGSGRLLEPERAELVTVTGFGLTGGWAHAAIGGTLRYSAPEVLAGGAPTTAADVYALGIMLYQMIAGDLDRPLTAGWDADIADPLLRLDVADAACGDPARRLLSAAALAERLETLEPRRVLLEAELQRAAEREQLLRAAELQRVEAAAAMQRARLATKLARRTRAAAATLTVLLLAASCVSVYALSERRIAARQRDRAEQVIAVAGDAVSSLVNNMAHGLRDSAGMSLDVRQRMLGGAEAIIARMNRYAPDDPRLLRLNAGALSEFADTYLHQGDLVRALQVGERAVALQRSLLARNIHDPQLAVELARSLRWVGDGRLKQHDFPAAMRAYAGALAILSAQLDADPTNLLLQQMRVRAEDAVGDVRLANGDADAALAAYRHAQAGFVQVASRNRADPVTQLDLSITEEKIGDVLDARHESQAALQSYLADLAIRRQLVARDGTNTGWIRDLAVAEGDVGDERFALHDFPGALASYQDGFRLTRQLVALDPANLQYQRDVASGLEEIGDTELALGDDRTALQDFRDGVDTMQRLVAISAPDVGFQQDLVSLRLDLAKALFKSGKSADATAPAAQALEVSRRLSAQYPGDPQIAGYLKDAQDVAAQLGRR